MTNHIKGPRADTPGEGQVQASCERVGGLRSVYEGMLGLGLRVLVGYKELDGGM